MMKHEYHAYTDINVTFTSLLYAVVLHLQDDVYTYIRPRLTCFGWLIELEGQSSIYVTQFYKQHYTSFVLKVVFPVLRKRKTP